MLERRWNILSPNPAAVLGLSLAQGISPLAATVMLNRGVDEKTAARFLNPSLRTMSNPDRMAGMSDASSRFADAIIDGQSVVLYGDMDADGTNSMALLSRFARMVACEFPVYIPHRVNEGYGLHKESLQAIKDEYAPDLIITADVGITAVEEAAFCRELGIDLIITDHHTPGEVLPEACAVVNPHRSDCPYPFKKLAGVGVAFALVVCTTRVLTERGYFAAGGEPDLGELLPLVALATVADVVELQGDNRALVAEGLKDFHSLPGLRALARVAGLSPAVQPTSGQLAFKYAPRINAAGRMDTAMLAYELLATDDEDRADELARILDSFNQERQTEEKRVLEEAVAQVEADPSLLRKTLVLSGSGWAPGVVGICAQRLIERFFRPVVMIADMGNGIGKGSCRSIPNFHLYNGLAEVGDLLRGFGGHPAAAGLTIDIERVPEFRDAFDQCEMARSLSDEDLVPVIEIDAVARAEDLSLKTIEDLKRLEPFGMGNRGPVFCVKGATVVSRRTLKDVHLKLQVEIDGQCFDAIGWGMAEKKTGKRADLAFALDVNEWNGKKTVQLILKDIRQ
ncbi:single-stranded-DNA-specific exonuclease RecJ [Geomonas subterranea]|uniref:single-stranded-DNA-specific exonuclease RecJ n=1 Tax=Geomonas subterranea TaxID=2847989 RepID=UPI001CD78E37|nr:single-stranded-DNA-specific exonuclease RecJ [Geomonas fuzhouensis]